MHRKKCAAVFIALAFLAACRETPPLPTVELKDFAAPVREQIEAARRQVVERPQDGERNGRLAMLYHVYRLDEPALTCYRRARQMGGNLARWNYLEGLIALRQARYPEAAKLLGDAVRQEPQAAVLRLRYAEALAGEEKTQEAARVYEGLVAEGRALPYAHFGWGKMLEAQSRQEEAIQHLEIAVQMAPAYREALYALAQAQRRAGDQIGAEVTMRQHRSAGVLTPPIEDPYRAELVALDISPQGFISRSVAHDHGGRLALAIEELQKGLALYPDNINTQANLISLYARVGDMAKAEEFFRRVVSVRPNLPEAHFYWANTLAAQGRYSEACVAIEKTLQLNPEYPAASTLAGDLFAVTKKPVEAEKHYRAALALRPEDAVANLGLGEVLWRKSRTGDAVAMLEKGKEAPGVAALRAYRLLDEAYAYLGLNEKRIRLLEEGMGIFAARGSAEDFAWIQKRLSEAGKKPQPGLE